MYRSLLLTPQYILLVLLCALVPTAEAQESSPQAYSGYSEAEYGDVAFSSTYIPLRDGERMAVDIYLPQEGPKRDGFPVVVQYTPYQRSVVDPKTGKISNLTRKKLEMDLVAHGYALVRADMRGTGASTGWLMDFIPALWEDGKELIDWIAEQSWCDGNVGMMGGSYLGWSQTATAFHRPKALKCIMPTVVPLEGYTGEVYPGGIYLQGFLKMWSAGTHPSQRSYYLPDQGVLPTLPAEDEDGDGELADEVPLDQNGNGTFLDDGYPPKYADGSARTRHVFYQAIKEHEKNLDYHSWAKESFFIDAPSPLGFDLSDLSPNAHVEAIMAGGIPIYNVGGWFDGFARGTMELYATMKDRNPSKVIMFPGFHSVTAGPYYEHLGYDRGAAADVLAREHFRFFDRYLKGIDNGIEEDDPIYLYTMHGDGWRFEKEWPLTREQRTSLFLTPDKQLQHEASTPGTLPYKADFTHSSTYGDSKGNRWVGIGGRRPSVLPDRAQKDQQCLTFTGDLLDDALEVTGHPSVQITVSSTEAYGDFFVYLEDVTPTGEAVLVTEGQLRAGFHRLVDNDLIVESRAVNVLPELPWHGYREADYVDGALADGVQRELVISLHPTSWVFRKGHRIRLTLACADWPTFRLHPQLSPANDPADKANRVPTITVHTGSATGSRLELPVIPE